MIKVLMISTDAKILEEGSLVRGRMAEYGTIFSEIHIVILSADKKAPESARIAPNVFAYPTRSLTKLLYLADGISLGHKIIKEQGLAKEGCVITAQDPFENGMVGSALSKKSGIPLHVQIHTDFQSPYFKKSALNKIRIALSKMVFPQAAAIRAVSSRIIGTLPADIRAKASVLPIYADIASIALAPVTSDLRKNYPQFAKVALVASRLTIEKDISSAIEAFFLVRKNMPGIGLVIVGSGSEEASLRQQAASMGLGEAVAFEPWVDHATLISYMKTCDAFVSTSLYEGYGLSMLEAHAAGAPLVATDAGIAPLLADESCLVGTRDVSGLAAALERALSGKASNKPYQYPYSSRKAYLDMYRGDMERTAF